MADRSHSPVKVAIFMEFFLPYLGGIERYQDRLSEQLRLLGYDVFIVTSLHDESLPRFEDKDGLRIYRLPTKGLFKQRYPFFKRDKRFKETMAAVEAENADFYIVNTRFHLTSLLGARLLTFATAAATAAAVLGRDGVGVDQLEHLTVSHVFSLSSGPTGHFSEPYPV